MSGKVPSGRWSILEKKTSSGSSEGIASPMSNQSGDGMASRRNSDAMSGDSDKVRPATVIVHRSQSDKSGLTGSSGSGSKDPAMVVGPPAPRCVSDRLSPRTLAALHELDDETRERIRAQKELWQRRSSITDDRSVKTNFTIASVAIILIYLHPGLP
eukprot:gene5479-11022_t